MSEQVQCENHFNANLIDTEEEWIKKCSTCGKTTKQMYDDVDDMDPTTRPSQQPHGDRTYYCGEHGYVKPTTWQGEPDCPYHQRVHMGEEGPEFAYDEFNQDGEEW